MFCYFFSISCLWFLLGIPHKIIISHIWFSISIMLTTTSCLPIIINATTRHHSKWQFFSTLQLNCHQSTDWLFYKQFHNTYCINIYIDVCFLDGLFVVFFVNTFIKIKVCCEYQNLLFFPLLLNWNYVLEICQMVGVGKYIIKETHGRKMMISHKLIYIHEMQMKYNMGTW